MVRPLLLSLLGLLLLYGNAQEVQVRVLLERTEGEIHVPIDEGHRGYVGGRLLFETALGITWPLSTGEGGLLMEGTPIGREFTLVPDSGTVQWRGNSYRGALRLVAEGETLLVVNVVELEDYLRGVVPAEMMADWPLEALKAQAVASRTYTLISLDRDMPFDVCATVECQVYAGIAAEHPRSDTAVANTTGLVLTYGGEFARTYYHSDSGGALASAAEVWGTALPYLASRSDVVVSTPHRRWRQELDGHLLARLLADRGYELGLVRSMRLISVTESGRALSAEFAGSSGSAVVSGSALTSLLREAGLKSTRFSMAGALVAQGDGWGHGVGMSQYGARSLALAGHPFDAILHFYYPETLLQRLTPTPDEAEQ